jgi:citrate synthase
MGFPTLDVHGAVRAGPTVGWIAQWKEMIEDPSQKIGRPRQLYVGRSQRDYPTINQRG